MSKGDGQGKKNLSNKISSIALDHNLKCKINIHHFILIQIGEQVNKQTGRRDKSSLWKLPNNICSAPSPETVAWT